MTNYRIGRVRIRNFKSITEFDEIFHNDLIVLDGPNGFGKTTLFDALELAMFGRIKRIDEYRIVDQKQGYRDSLYSNNPQSDILIQIQFGSQDDEAESFVISKVLPKVKQSKSKKPSYSASNSPVAWENFQTYITPHFVDDFKNVAHVSQEQVHEALGLTQLIRAFHLFYYIQQEEKSFFLKSNEKTRLEELSTLFDTKKEEEERQHIAGVQKTIAKRLTDLGRDIENAKKDYETRQQSLSLEVKESVVYTPLFSTETRPLWDTELSTVTDNLRNKCHEELSQIKDLLLHIQDYESATFNKQLNAFADNMELLEWTVILGNFLTEEPETVKSKFRRQQVFKQWLHRLEKNQLRAAIHNGEIWDELFSMVNDYHWNVDTVAASELVSEIKQHHESMNALSAIVVSINETRKTLQEQYTEFLRGGDASPSECPMCGYNWESLEQLVTQLDSKRQMFESFSSASASVISQLLDEHFDKYISPILEAIRRYLEEPNNTVDELFYRQWERTVKYRERVMDFLQWCQTRGYDLSPFLNRDSREIDDFRLTILVTNLLDFLQTKRSAVQADYNEGSEKFTEFESLIRNLFNGDLSQVQIMTPAKVNQKKAYIDNLYYRHNQQERMALEIKLKIWNAEKNALGEYSSQITLILDIYDRSIREHWSKIIADIEVIFYLYFGKITQYYQRGLGMFVQQYRESDKKKEQEAAKSLRFVYGPDSDHDAINFLSSGQLSALIIAFTLSLNRVYNRGISVLLIDDPVQTMDDINMASLTELLRNDFRDKQIILSTHEDEVARYLKYKFHKYGLRAERLNMKEKYLQAPQLVQ